MARRGHVGCSPGKRVCLVLKDGQRRYGRFKDNTDRWVELDDGVRVPMRNLRTFIVLKAEHRDPKGAACLPDDKSTG